MSNPVRQLAAIMFTDLVGYTSLMSKNEDEAYAVLRKNRELHKRHITKNDGRFLKEMGDGILASFTSTTNAIKCAIAIQEQSESVAPLSLRIGIHLGEVLFEAEDVFGDGVNIASRIEAKAKPGSIYVSESVISTLKNKPEFESVFVGSERLKNVSKPVKIYRLRDSSDKVAKQKVSIQNQRKFRIALLIFLLMVILVSVYSAFYNSDSIRDVAYGKEVDQSIAVLPFRNLSSDEVNTYFTEGVMSSIHSHLSSINDLQVTSLTSSENFRESGFTSPEIAEQLGVSYLVEGSVQKMADNYMISVNLIEGSSDRRIWNDSYQMKLSLDELLSAQVKIAEIVIDKMRGSLSPQEKKRIERIPTKNLKAYENFQKGLYHNRQIQNRIKETNIGIEYFRTAIYMDRNFAEAYAGLAESYSTLAYFELKLDFVDSARKYVDKALAINPELAVALNVKAYILKTFDWKWEESKKLYLKAMNLDPSNSIIMRNYSLLLCSTNDLDSAEKVANKALSIDPFNPAIVENMVRMFEYQKKYDEGLTFYEEHTKILGNPELHALNLYLAGGDTLTALKILVDFPEVSDEDSTIFYQAIESGEYMTVFQELESYYPESYENQTFLGNYERGLDLLEDAVSSRDGMMTYILVDPSLDPYRGMPRFEALIKRMGLDIYR